MLRSKRWSFVSFNGIGFDYASHLAIERSRARVIELKYQQIVLKIKNQVFLAYDELSVLNQRIALQGQAVASSEGMDRHNTELYENEMIPLSQFLESRNTLLGEKRTLLRLQMQRLVKLARLKRLLGLDASLNSSGHERYAALELSATRTQARRGTNILLQLQGPQELLANVVSVTYYVPRVFDHTSENMHQSFAYYFRFRIRGEYDLLARIRLISGEEIIKNQKIVIE